MELIRAAALPITLMIAMQETQKGGSIRCLRSRSALWIFIVAANILPLLAGTLQIVPPGHTRDNSDWWSFLRRKYRCK
jgi:hypothetical protein